VDEPSKVIRELLKQRMLKLDSLGHLDQRGNIHQLSKLENLVSGKSVVVVFELIVKLKIENKLPDFIGAWKRLSSVASKSEVLITN
jgi:hypothetical protein